MRPILILCVALAAVVALGAVTAWEKDETGRVSLNTDAVLTSPDVSGIQFVKDEDGRQTFKTQADADAHAAAVAARNGISQCYLNGGDTFELVLRVNGADFATIASGTVKTAAGTQGVLYIRARLGRDAIAPAEPKPEGELP